MLRRVKDRCRVSTVVLALALVATAFLPDLLAGRQDVLGHPDSLSGGPAVGPESTPASFTDTTSADFNGGSLDAGTYVSETADGEVILAPAFGTEFSGDSLPAGMFTSQWFPPSGVATFAGGKVTLDGVLLGTDALFSQGRTLEFSGNIGGASLDSLGLGTNLTAAPWGVFRTGLFVFNLMTSTNDGTAQSGTVPGAVFDAFHRYRIDWAAGGVSYYVDGVLVITNTNSPTADMRPLFSNLFFGGKNNTLDWVRLTPYAAAGTFESRIFDAGSSAHFLDLVSTASMPDGTSIVYETRSGDTASPDATWSEWQAYAGGAIASPNARYIQYRALLGTSNPSITPEVQMVVINYEAGCTDEICNGVDDDCDGEIDEDGAALCDDENACTTDACIEGQCDSRPAPGSECSDGDACTTGDVCDETGSCVGSPLTCDDENACTKDACVDGACVFTPTSGETCDDGDACTSQDTCNEDGRCVGVGLTCDDENACTKDSCEGGQCVFTPTPGETCDDHDACTRNDVCNADAKCAGTALHCDDENACTRDACVDGQCVFTPTPGATCDDGNACTSQDSCNEDGRCVGVGLTCDDENACTKDSCEGGQCVFTPTPGETCDDHDACTSGDVCNADAKCAGTALHCDDENACTRDACVDGQCVFTPTPGATCDDGNACTTDDKCNEDGRCVGVGTTCDDHNACTRDACVNGECVYTPTQGEACDDGDACTRGDACNTDGRCVGAPVVCNDENSCTKDACVGGECTFTPTPGDSCDDGNACTRNDTCNSDGRCVGSAITCDDENACTRDACVGGQCVFTPTPNVACNDGNACTNGDTCNTDGRCVGSAISCNDENACTNDSCDPAKGCVFDPNTAPCNDGNACTTNDTCRQGQCAGGPPLSCDDGNACTADSCNPASGCVHDPHITFQPVCSISPTTLNVNAQGNSFSMDLSLVNTCNPGAPSPIPPSSIGITHVSRAGNTLFPDPASLSCPDSGGGTGFETGLFEDLAARNVTGGSLSLKFDRASDGNCHSQDGNRQDLLAALSDVTNGANADICISGMAGGEVFQCCTSARILNRGNR